MEFMDTPAKSLGHLLDAYAHYQDQFADDAAFLWLLRSNAINQPHYHLADLNELDQRIDAQLDGLMTAPEESWEVCEASLALQQPGEAFVASALAFRSLDVRKIQIAVEAGLADTRAFEGLVSAMAWLPGRLVHSWIKKFLTSKDLDHKHLALAVCSARREDPREYLTTILQRSDCLTHEKLYARGLRLIGELKRFDLIPALRQGVSGENTNTRFWAHWSAILLGDKTQVAQLQEWVLNTNPMQRRAIELCFRTLPADTARDWITRLAQDPANQRLVIHATAVLGDPQAINWLLIQMHKPALTRLAGEAFTTITGIDLVAHKLVLEDIPELEDVLPDDGAQNEEIDTSEDQHLPFPDTAKLAAVWQKYQQRFASGQRYFMGQMLGNNQQSSEHLRHVYETGTQRQRAAAALELSLLEPSQYLLNHAAKEIMDE
jgi:uncharacterized protein (TIGR02270 family)